MNKNPRTVAILKWISEQEEQITEEKEKEAPAVAEVPRACLPLFMIFYVKGRARTS